MRDSRIQQIRALLDDVRALCADMLEELPAGTPDANRLTITSGFCHAAILALQRIAE